VREAVGAVSVFGFVNEFIRVTGTFWMSAALIMLGTGQAIRDLDKKE